jgi:hypothetical protein
VEAWLLLSLGRGSAFWRDDKRPWIIQRELSAAPGFAWNNMLSRVHLCAHWKIFNSGINFAGRKMWLFGIVTGRRCSEIGKFVWLNVVVVLLDKMGLDRALWLGFEIGAKHCIVAGVIEQFWSL